MCVCTFHSAYWGYKKMLFGKRKPPTCGNNNLQQSPRTLQRGSERQRERQTQIERERERERKRRKLYFLALSTGSNKVIFNSQRHSRLGSPLWVVPSPPLFSPVAIRGTTLWPCPPGPQVSGRADYPQELDARQSRALSSVSVGCHSKPCYKIGARQLAQLRVN